MAMRSSDSGANSDEVASTYDILKRFGPPGVLGLAALLFIVQNTKSVQFTFLWFEFNAPLWVMLIVFAVVGALVFWFIARRRRKRKSTD